MRKANSIFLKKIHVLPKLLTRKQHESFSSHLPIRVEKLHKRAILLIEGNDSLSFLQNLITCDMRQFENAEKKAAYGCFLNMKGRIIHDVIIYRARGTSAFYVECDNSTSQALKVHMQMYKINKNVEISNLENETSVWVVFCPKEIDKAMEINEQNASNTVIDVENDDDDKNSSEFLTELDLGDNSQTARDPRLWQMGLRVISAKSENILNRLKDNKLDIVKYNGSLYRLYRYKIGLAESVDEMAYGRLLPLEANLDFTNGVSFSKGDFLGKKSAELQQPRDDKNLKRIVPLKLPNPLDFISYDNHPIEDRFGRRITPIGYLCGVHGRLGIGLVRMEEGIDGLVRIGKMIAECSKPFWWPSNMIVSKRLQKQKN